MMHNKTLIIDLVTYKIFWRQNIRCGSTSALEQFAV